jgi:hypothetical protein
MNMATVTEIRAFYQKSYVEELTARLREKAEEGELSDVLEGEGINGGILGGVDETAANETKNEYGWKSTSVSIEEALGQPECYDGIDFAAIIEEARSVPVLA